MTRKFCSNCLTFHEGRCPPGALAKAGNGKPAKKARSSVAERAAHNVAGSIPAAPTPEGYTEGVSFPESSKEQVREIAEAAQEFTKEELIDALTVQLPKAEADKLRELAAKMEANAKANRERVAAHKLGITVAEYRARQKP